jgi:hypothetical protein
MVTETSNRLSLPKDCTTGTGTSFRNQNQAFSEENSFYTGKKKEEQGLITRSSLTSQTVTNLYQNFSYKNAPLTLEADSRSTTS